MNTRDQKASIMGRGTVFPLGIFTPGEMRGMLGLYPQFTQEAAAPVAAAADYFPAWVWADRRRHGARSHNTSPLTWRWR